MVRATAGKEIGVTNPDPITFEMDVISQAQVDAFRRATRTSHAAGIPPTFATLFRKAEFEWADRLTIDVGSVVHAEQDYEYLVPLAVGDRPVVTTALRNLRGRSGMVFLVLESTVTCNGTKKMIASTTFVVRELAKESV